MGTLRPILMSNSEIAQRYLAGTPISELALRCKTSFPIIKAILQCQGVPLRSRSEQLLLSAEDRRNRIHRKRIRLMRLAGHSIDE